MALPFSWEISRAYWSAWAVISSNADRRISARSRGAVAAQSAAACCAASTAAIASATSASATLVITSPVAGSSTSNRAPDSAGTSLPPMCSSVGRSTGTPSVWVGDDEVLGREQRQDARAVLGDHDLLLDAGRREAVRRRAVGLQREHHAGAQFDRFDHAVEPRDDRPLVQAETEAVAELEAESVHLGGEAEFRRLRPHGGDLVGPHTRPHDVDGRVHPLPRPGVGVALAGRCAADAERAVVAGAVAVE